LIGEVETYLNPRTARDLLATTKTSNTTNESAATNNKGGATDGGLPGLNLPHNNNNKTGGSGGGGDTVKDGGDSSGVSRFIGTAHRGEILGALQLLTPHMQLLSYKTPKETHTAKSSSRHNNNNNSSSRGGGGGGDSNMSGRFNTSPSSSSPKTVQRQPYSPTKSPTFSSLNVRINDTRKFEKKYSIDEDDDDDDDDGDDDDEDVDEDEEESVEIKVSTVSSPTLSSSTPLNTSNSSSSSSNKKKQHQSNNKGKLLVLAIPVNNVWGAMRGAYGGSIAAALFRSILSRLSDVVSVHDYLYML
jgi:hypothetical protein